MRKFQKEIATFVVISSLLLLGYTFLIKGTVTSQDLWKINCGDCTTCGKCEVNCVKSKSAVVAKIDTTKITTRLDNPAYFKNNRKTPLDTSVANLICPTGALQREVINDSTARYSIDEKRCTGCGKCVAKSQGRNGDKAICLVIDAKECLDCNECSIAKQCPAKAIERGEL